ncbi:MAG: signal peptidase II [candidate division WOR-3 bacterium]
MRMMTSLYKTTFLFLLSVILGIIDLLTKFWVLHNMPYMKPVNIIGDLLRFTLVLNPNTAFGISLGESFPYAYVAIALAILVAYLLIRENDNFSKLMYALILGGAIGNITDRIINGAVVDFVDIGVGNLRWFTFNLADVYVSLGIMGLILRGLFAKNEGVRSYGGIRKRACNSGEGN